MVFFFSTLFLMKDTLSFRPGRVDIAHLKIISASRIISAVSAAVIWKIQKLRAFKKPSIDNRKSCSNFEDIVKKSKIN